jgi:BirA family transcriptional regulator, biotin operon repressor / biotin---[acetyl-CoA-carboxylase] ligase
MDVRILHFESLGSTNTEAADQARRGAPEGVCVIAAQQTAGRGRYGRTWISPPGTGLYLSIILRPQIAPAQYPLITLMSGIAVHETLKIFGVAADIKWVNDLLVREKKIGGILAEAVETPPGTAVIVGIGLNLQTPETADTGMAVTSVYDETEKIISPAEMALMLTQKLSYWYAELNQKDGPKTIIGEWGKRSSYLRGKPVRVTVADRVLTGVTDGLEENGALRVIEDDGSLTRIQTGDVERLRTRAA